MGILHDQWALPKNTKILDKAKLNTTYCECFEFVWLNEDENIKKIETEYIKDMKEAYKMNPFAGKRFEFNKSWDSIFFHISEQRRSEESKEPYDIHEQAIFGEKDINPKAMTVTGFEFRYIDHSRLNTLISRLKEITIKDFIKIKEDYKESSVYGKRFYTTESCWQIFKEWQEFLYMAELRECHIICFSH
ncbi:hypothetical protein ATO12_10260 [Aquimarina atlantica]|uniref:Uncharacterized protein n=1 Tax=Aquimarina atlantica TaxID=1317122 RepID=A0A023BYM1_9FLAO|nr:DUF1877 family protein [Aquimarina atlantica]EZH75100.1 hypothetical protein ATO12_10260 [Aquimarina atlantica]